MTELKKPTNVQIGDGNFLQAISVGKVPLQLQLLNNETLDCTADKVLYVPNLCYNLLSIPKITENGKTIEFCDAHCNIFSNDKNLIGIANKVGNLFHLDCISAKANVCNSNNNEDLQYLWHQRYGHLGISNLRKLVANELVGGMQFDIKDEHRVCNNCCDGKNHRVPFPKTSKKKYSPFELVHSNVCGKISPSSIGGGNYFLTFIDEATYYVWIYILHTKDQVFQKFQEWKTLVEKKIY